MSDIDLIKKLIDRLDDLCEEVRRLRRDLDYLERKVETLQQARR